MPSKSPRRSQAWTTAVNMVSRRHTCTGRQLTWCNPRKMPFNAILATPLRGTMAVWIGRPLVILVIQLNGAEGINKMTKRNLVITLGLLLAIIAFIGIRSVLAKPALVPLPAGQASPLHPAFALLDQNAENVLTSGNPVSTMQTCGQCHDTVFIQSHAFHSDLGLSDYKENGGYNASTGTFGKWDPLTYRFLSQQGDERLDLGTPEWLMLYGDRIVGGGPGRTSRNGGSLESVARTLDNPEATIL